MSNNFGLGESDEFSVDGEKMTVLEATKDGLVYRCNRTGNVYEESLGDFRERLLNAEHWKIYRKNSDGEVSESHWGRGNRVIS